jgi:hypothetical protein
MYYGLRSSDVWRCATSSPNAGFLGDTMETRRSLSKKLRFEVFKRDSFTCQYCGAKSPEVVLQADHIDPVASGGTDDLLNLITSCQECNSGKSDRKLSDTTVVEKRQRQLAELQDRREQIEMMMEWQRELTRLADYQVEQLASYWAELAEPYALNESGNRELKKLIAKYAVGEVAEAMRVSIDRYVEYSGEEVLQPSIELAWKKVGSICSIKRSEQRKPYLKDIFYIRAILRNRFQRIDESLAYKLLEGVALLGVDLEELKDHAIGVRNWSQWRSEIEDFIRRHQ